MNLQAAKLYNDKHEKQLKQVEKILGETDRVKKWRAATAYYLQEHPEAVAIYKSVAADCLKRRKEVEFIQAGTNRTAKKSEMDENMHARVDLPSFVHYAICTFDPEFATIMTGSETNFAQKKWARLLKKAFPEFIVQDAR